MDQPITRAEHEEFRRRLEEENSRQDRRIALLEESVSKMGALSTSVVWKAWSRSRRNRASGWKRWKIVTVKCGARPLGTL